MTFTNFISEHISAATLRIGTVLLGTLLVAGGPLFGSTAFADAEQDETNAAMRAAFAERDLAVVEIHGLDGPVERLLSPAQERDLMALEAYGITDRGGQLAVVADVSQRERDRIVAELHTGSPAQAEQTPIVTDFAGQMERDRMVAELHEGSTGGTAFAVRTDFTAEMERDQLVAALNAGFSTQAEQAAIVVDLSAWQERDLAALEVYALTADGESTPVVVVDLAGWQDRDLRALEIYGIDAQGERTLIVVAR